jgi:hypothetical protein
MMVAPRLALLVVALLATVGGHVASAQTLNKASLAFGSLGIGQSSKPKAVTLTNTTPAPITINSVAIGGPAAGDYSVSTTCPVGGVLNVGKRCKATVTLTPTAGGPRTATLTFDHTGAASPQSVSLAGTGTAPVSVSPSSLSFGNVTAGSTSPAKLVTVSNGQTVPVAFTNISAAGDFVVTGNTCGASIGPGASCVISVAFAPAALGARNGTLTIAHDAPASPQSVALTGNGTQALKSNKTALTFSPRAVGTTSPEQSVTLTNYLTTAIDVAIDAPPDYAVTSTCGSRITPGAVCTLRVTFTPTRVGALGGTLTIAHTAPGSPLLIALNGSGTATGLVSITVTPANPTIAPDDTQAFTATGRFSDGHVATLTSSVTWSSSAPAVATIAATGVATGEAVGESTITATLGAISGSTLLTVAGASVTAIAVTPSMPSIALGRTQQFTAIATFTDGSTADVTATALWASATEATATISATGLATSVAQGTTLISATVGSVSGSTTLTVTAAELVSLSVTPDDVTIAVGATQQYTATGTYSDGTTSDITASVSWSSATTATATISSAGLATGVAAGTSEITATQGLISDSTTLTVFLPIAVTATTPASGATSVLRNTAISVIFNTAANPATITTNTADTTCSGSLQVSSDGFASCVRMAAAPVGNGTNTIFTVTPAAALAGVTQYQIRVTTAVTDAAGRALGAQFTTSPGFTTRSALEVTLTSPADAQTGVPLSTTIRVTFNAAINAATLTTNTADTSCSGSLQVSSDNFATCVRMTSAPVFEGSNRYRVQNASSLIGSTTYRIRVSTAVQDTSGLGLTPAYESATGFTTVAATLNVISVTPSPTTLGLGKSVQLTATGTFSDGTTQDLTSTAAWTTSSRSRASVTSGGLATVLATGSTSVIATSAPRSGNATVIGVSPTHLRRLHTATVLQDGRLLIAGGHDGSSPTPTAELFDRNTGLFTATGDMTTARYEHTATLLPDGKVLVTGGFNSSGQSLASAELYDPVSGTWTPTGSMSTIRAYHTANLVGTKVLVAAGYSSSVGQLNTAELYDPALGTFAPTGALANARYVHASVQLADGRVMVVGGASFGASPAEAYSPSTGTWSSTGPLAVGRYYHTATLLGSGDVLVAGGVSVSSGTVLSSAERYNAASGTWSAVGSMASARYQHTATLLDSGRVLVAGGFGGTGQGAEVYDPAADRFDVALNLAFARQQHTASKLGGGEVLLVGGSSSSSTAELRIDSIFVTSFTVSPPTRTITLQFSTSYAALGTFSDGSTGDVTQSLTWSVNPGTVAVISGPGSIRPINVGSATVSASTGSTSVDALLTVDKVASSVTNGHQVRGLTHLRSHHTATLLGDGRVLLAGGHDLFAGVTPTSELYDPASDTTTQTGSMNVRRQNHTATLLPDGRVLVTGGIDATGASLSSAEVYDPATGVWTPVGSMSSARAYHTATMVGSLVLVAGGYNSTAIPRELQNAELFDPATDTFAATGMMIGARYQHTATLLPDNRVLVAGGRSPSSFGVTAAETFDPASGTWSATGAMAHARLSHTATLLSTNEVLVAGGAPIFGSENTAELYDYTLGTWRPAGNMHVPRTSHTATLLIDGRVLLAGSSSGPNSAEVYDPATNAFTIDRNLAQSRTSHTATRLGSGHILLAGGTSTSAAATLELRTPDVTLTGLSITPAARTVQLGSSTSFTATATFSDGSSHNVSSFVSWSVTPTSVAYSQNGSTQIRAVGVGDATVSVSSGAFSASASLTVIPVPPQTISGQSVVGLRNVRQRHTATLLADGRVLIAGGFDGQTASAAAELYDPAAPLASAFSATAAMNVARYSHTATLLPDGRVLVTGGYDEDDAPVSSAEVFDPSAGTWTPVGSMTAPRALHTATLVGTNVLIAGGTNDTPTQWLNSAELFDVGAGTFAAAAPMATARYQHAATLLSDGRVLVTGGRSSSSLGWALAEIYNPATGIWTNTGSMSAPRHLHAATLLATNQVLVTGGSSNFSPTNTAELYDPVSGTWTPTGSMTVARQGHTSTLRLDGRVVVAGNDTGTNSVEIYDTAAGAFTAAANMAFGRSGHTATLLQTGNVLIVGGSPTSTSGATAELRSGSAVLTALQVNPASRTITLGSFASYQAIGTFSDGSTADVTNAVTWSVSPSSVGNVNSPGFIRGVGLGTATVTAAAGGISATATLIVQ